jgi:hypothetical protein
MMSTVRRGLLPLSSAILAALGGAAGSGLLASDAAAQVSARRDDEDAPPPLLVVPSNARPPILLAGHSSHSSHSSHRSHSSHYSSSGGHAAWSPPDVDETPSPPPPPKPAHVSVAAYPGGAIFIDGRPIAHDVTATLTLQPGSHTVKIVNRFLGEFTGTIDVVEGQIGTIPVHW